MHFILKKIRNWKIFSLLSFFADSFYNSIFLSLIRILIPCLLFFLFKEFNILRFLFVIFFSFLSERLIFIKIAYFIKKIFTYEFNYDEILEILEKKKFFLNDDINKSKEFKVIEIKKTEFFFKNNIHPLVDFYGKLVVENQSKKIFYLFFHSSFPKELFLKIKEYLDNNKIFNKSLNYSYSKDFSFFGTIEGILIISLIFIIFSLSFAKIFGKSNDDILKDIFNYLFIDEEKIYKIVYPKDINCNIEEFKGEKVLLNRISGLIDYLKEKESRKNGIVFYGQPGTGKSFLASIIAKELNGCIFYIDGASLNGSLLSISKNKNLLKGIFEDAEKISKKNKGKKVVIFIDEIDKQEMGFNNMLSIGINSLSQGIGDNYGNGGKELLEIFDGGLKNEKAYIKYPNVILIVTCNNIKWFNKAVLRSGRLDEIIEIRVPDSETLKEIIFYNIFNTLKEKCIIFNEESLKRLSNKVFLFLSKFLLFSENKNINFVGADITKALSIFSFNENKRKLKITKIDEDKCFYIFCYGIFKIFKSKWNLGEFYWDKGIENSEVLIINSLSFEEIYDISGVIDYINSFSYNKKEKWITSDDSKLSKLSFLDNEVD